MSIFDSLLRKPVCPLLERGIYHFEQNFRVFKLLDQIKPQSLNLFNNLLKLPSAPHGRSMSLFSIARPRSQRNIIHVSLKVNSVVISKVAIRTRALRILLQPLNFNVSSYPLSSPSPAALPALPFTPRPLPRLEVVVVLVASAKHLGRLEDKHVLNRTVAPRHLLQLTLLKQVQLSVAHCFEVEQAFAAQKAVGEVEAAALLQVLHGQPRSGGGQACLHHSGGDEEGVARYLA